MLRNVILTGTLASSVQKKYYYPFHWNKKIQMSLISFRISWRHTFLPYPSSNQYKNIPTWTYINHDLMWWVYQGLQEPKSSARKIQWSGSSRVKTHFIPVRGISSTAALNRFTGGNFLEGRICFSLQLTETLLLFFWNVPSGSRKNLLRLLVYS